MIATWSGQQPYFRSGGGPVNKTAPSITPSTASIGTPLTCSNGTWDYAVSFSFQWLLAGAPIVGEVLATLNTSLLAIGDVLSCQVTATSPSGKTTTIISSNSITLTP